MSYISKWKYHKPICTNVKQRNNYYYKFIIIVVSKMKHRSKGHVLFIKIVTDVITVSN